MAKIYKAKTEKTREAVEGELYYIDEINPFKHQAWIKYGSIHVPVDCTTIILVSDDEKNNLWNKNHFVFIKAWIDKLLDKSGLAHIGIASEGSPARKFLELIDETLEEQRERWLSTVPPVQEGEELQKNEDGWYYDVQFLSQLREKVNEQEFGEGLGMEEVEAVLLAIGYGKSIAAHPSPEGKEAVEMLDFCHFLGENGYKINGYDDGQLITIINQFTQSKTKG